MADPSKMEQWQRQMERMNLDGGGGTGGNGPSSVDSKVGRLEAFVEVIRESQRDTSTKLDKIVDAVNTLPTKADLNTWKWQWLAVSVAIIAIITTLVFGGLDYLKP